MDVPIRNIGLPQQFLDHASRDEVLTELGLTASDIARRITDWLAALGTPVAEREVSQRLD